MSALMQAWWPPLVALAQVLLIDLVLAADNAVVVGLAVAGLPPPLRRRAMVLGIGLATVLRIALALVALRLLEIVGLTLAGGVLLLWVAWRMARELHASEKAIPGFHPQKTLATALWQITLADLSMSLDNVLALAGAARDHPWVLATGLVISVLLMGLAAQLVARLMQRAPWIGWVGLAMILFVALRMIWEGGFQVGMF